MPYSISLASPTGKLEKPGSTTYSLNLKSIPAPQPGPHDLLVRISAAALNHRDVFSRRGLYPGVALDVPLLADGTGVVVGAGSAVPPAVRERWQGRRVVLAPARGWAAAPAAPEQPDEPGAERDGVGKVHPFAILGGTRFYPNGTLQNFVSVDAGQVEEAPAHLTDAEAAALPLAGLTAWRALVSKAGVRDARANGGTGSGDAVLITGIGGGVALAALQFAVARGASVVVTSSSPAKIEAAVRMGALGGVDYRQRGWAKVALGLLPEEKKKAGGFDAAIDGAGGDLMREVAGVMKVFFAFPYIRICLDNLSNNPPFV